MFPCFDKSVLLHLSFSPSSPKTDPRREGFSVRVNRFFGPSARPRLLALAWTEGQEKSLGRTYSQSQQRRDLSSHLLYKLSPIVCRLPPVCVGIVLYVSVMNFRDLIYYERLFLMLISVLTVASSFIFHSSLLKCIIYV